MNRLLLLAALVLAGLGCNRKSPSEGQTADGASFDQFMAFYNRFHQDSAFQMAHILFPLEGLPSYADSLDLEGGAFRWKREDWKLQRGFDVTSGFEREFTPVTDKLIVERMVHESGEFAMERRWGYLNDEWYLIYYAGINRMGK